MSHDEKRPTIILLARAPRPGDAKTRLARSIGADAACAVHRWLTERQIAALPRGWPLVVAYSPFDAEAEMRAWLGEGVMLLPQCEGHLGSRMQAVSCAAFSDGAFAVILIGADCPTLQAPDFDRALQLLESGVDVVFGPASDGGYYLLGLRRDSPGLFHDIPWSTDRTLAVSLETSRVLGLRVELLDPKDDVDDIASLDCAIVRGHVPVLCALVR